MTNSLEKELLEICNRFKADASKKGKAALLEEYKDNESFKQYLKYVLDPAYTYGLQDKKIKKFLGKVDATASDKMNIFHVFEYLIEHPTGTDLIAKDVAKYIGKFEEDEDLVKFVLESLTKKMKLGISPKTVNSVYGKGFMTNFEIMLAKKYEEESHKVKGAFFITEKFDGQRCAFIKKGEDIKAYSRSGERILGLVDIEKSISQLPDGMFDGELLIKTHEELKDREVLQQTLKITRKDGEKHGVDFYIFDYITLQEFENGKSVATYIQRRQFLESLTIGSELVLAPILYKGSDHDTIPPLLKAMEDKGREGLMLNIGNAPYESKRTHNILKLKTMQTADLRVIGFEEGSGKHKGSLGALTCNYKNFKLKVGSGLSDSDRREFFDNQEKYLNKIVTVQYFRESANDNGGLSLSFPVYICIRDDKNEESYY